MLTIRSFWRDLFVELVRIRWRVPILPSIKNRFTSEVIHFTAYFVRRPFDDNALLVIGISTKTIYIFMKFCSECAHPVVLQIPPDDNRPRFVCGNCALIHYQNPKLVIGSIPVWERDGELRLLLCRRAIEPRHGYWTLPAGFMENGESTTAAAIRETEEEAGARIKLGALFALINVPHVHQVHLFYLAELLDLDYAAGTESLEVALFKEADIPWTDIAFPTITYTLRSFFADIAGAVSGACKSAGRFGLHTDDIRKHMMQAD